MLARENASYFSASPRIIPASGLKLDWVPLAKSEGTWLGWKHVDHFVWLFSSPPNTHNTWHFNIIIKPSYRLPQKLVLFSQGSPGARGPPGEYGAKGFPGDPVSYQSPAGSEFLVLFFFPLCLLLICRQRLVLGVGEGRLTKAYLFGKNLHLICADYIKIQNWELKFHLIHPDGMLRLLSSFGGEIPIVLLIGLPILQIPFW